MKKLTIIFFVCLLFSCTKQENKQLANIENLMLTYPNSAYTLLQKDSASICKEGKDAQMYYQIIRCRVADLLYIPHTSDSTMLKVTAYYAKQNNKKALCKSYYCLGCIYRDLKNHPLAINYFLKAIDADSLCAPKELIARSYYQLAGLEENRNNNAQAVLYNKLAYKYIATTKDQYLANSCLIDIAHNYHFLNKKKEYDFYIKMARKNIAIQKDTVNLSRLIIAEGQVAVIDKNYKKLENLIKEGKRELTSNEIHKCGFDLMQGYYYNYRNMPDSAIFYFTNALTKEGIIGKYTAYNALSEIKAEMKDYTTAWNYLKLAKVLRDKADSIDNKQEAEKMKASYNYEMEVAKRVEAEESNNTYKYAMLLGIICTLGLSTLILAQKNSAKKKSIKQLKLIAQQNEQILKQENKIEEQENRMQEHKKNIKKLETRNNELSKYQLTSSENCIKKLAKNIKLDDDRWTQFRMSEAYMILHQMIRNGLNNYSGSEQQQAIEAIKITIDSTFSEYGKRLTAIFPSLKDTQIKFAYLVKAEISFSNMAILLSKSKSSITKISKSFDEFFKNNIEKKDVITFLREF